MRTKHIAFMALLVAIVLMFTGCDALFQNAFKTLNLGQPSGTTLQEQLNSTDPNVQQTAQVTIIQTKLEDTGAQEIVDAFTGVIALAAGGGDVLSDPGKMLDALVPTDLQSDPTKLATAINGLVDLKSDFTNLADQIKANEGEAAAGVDTASLAQTALMVAVLSSLEPADPAMSTGTAVAELITNPDATPDSLFNAPDFSGIESDPSTNTLLEAAGYGTLEDFFASFTNVK